MCSQLERIHMYSPNFNFTFRSLIRPLLVPTTLLTIGMTLTTANLGWSDEPNNSESHSAASDKSGGELQEVVVTGTEGTSEASALQDARLAPNIENVRSAEEIAKYPDVNMADVLKRMPGVGVQNDTGEGRFITLRGLDSNLVGTTFGGVRVPSTDLNGRHVAFDQIPSGLVSQVVITKSNIPSMDAEALGGTIELTPRSAFDQSAPIFQGHMGSGYEPLRPKYPIIDGEIIAGATFGFGPGGNPFSSAKSHDSQTASVDQSPDGKDDKSIDTKNAGSGSDLSQPYRPFGILGQFSYYQDHRGVSDIEPAYSDGASPFSSSGSRTGTDKVLSSIDLRNYLYNRRLHGYGGTFDYRPDNNNSYYLSFSDSGYVESVQRRRLDYLGLDGSNPVPVGQNPNSVFTTLPNGSFKVTNAQLESSLRLNEETFETTILQGGGRNNFGPFIIDYKAAFAQASDSNPRDLNVSFRTNPNQTITYNNRGASNQPQFILGSPNPYNPSQYAFNQLSFDRYHSLDTEISGSANVTVPILLLGNQSNLKFGSSVRFRTKSFSDHIQNYTAAPGSNFTLADVAGSPSFSIYNGFYRVGQQTDPGRLQNFFSLNGASFVRNTQADAVHSLRAFMDSSENVFAGYGQYDITVGPLNFLAGLRVEATDAVYGAFANSPGSDPNLPSSYHRVDRPSNYINYFPTAQVRYEIIPNILQTRFSYSTAIGRPAFNQVTASTVVDTGNSTITTGNPNLKPITANNFDLTLEYYPSRDSIFSVGIFDKEFQNYIFARSIQTVVNGTVFRQNTFVNSPSSYARGIELNWEQHLSFLPSPLDGFEVTANYTYVDSEGQPRLGDHTKLPFTSPNTFNLALIYQKYGVTLSLAGQYTDRNLSSVGSTFRTDQYFDHRFVLDFAASYEFTKGLALYFNAKNLTDAPWRIYEGSPNRPIQREIYDVTYEAGVKFKF
jgi:TonB-dependent receptor